jgi:hypothetical protein
VITHREPNPDEARIQAMSVIAACAKGLMYFQSEVSLISTYTISSQHYNIVIMTFVGLFICVCIIFP